jgi:hypothetical protein
MEVIHLIILYIENGIIFTALGLLHLSVVIIGLALALVFTRWEIREDLNNERGILEDERLS